ERWRERRYNESGNSHIWTGFFILLIGVAALLRNTLTDVPEWVFSWPMFLVALGLFIGLKHKFKGGAWFLMILIGSAFLINRVYPDIAIRQYIFPGILILIGGMLILRPRRVHCQEKVMGQKKNSLNSGIKEEPTTEETYPNEKDYKEDFVDSTSLFGGSKKNIISKNFKGGDLISIFGGTELDLTRADFKGTAVLELTTIFGGTKLVVPADWTVKSEAVTIFGGLEDKRNMQTVTDNPEKVLLLKGTVIFGGTEIKSY
ncbi:MAG TPA: LiaF domain-containing protein, partial [Chitinophagaceae bacterium]|nr:LiaF domain-containing protein [Chitinophagaceae bacterium]